MLEVLKSRISNRERYNRTVSELSALTNRDLGILCADIPQLAHQAVSS
jgi:uncharacterized protein YjiS (DUF1127 family)